MKPTIMTERYALCPGCGKHKFAVEHLFAMFDSERREHTAGPWYCDECGRAYNFAVNEDGLDIALNERAGAKRATSVVLRIPPRTEPIWLLVEGMRFSGPERERDNPDEGDRYFYEEHTCPTNWMHAVRAVHADGQSDPHGIAEYVATVDRNIDADGDADGDAEAETILELAIGRVADREPVH